MLDTEILDLFFARNEMAIVETDRKYGGYCFFVANSILSFAHRRESKLNSFTNKLILILACYFC